MADYSYTIWILVLPLAAFVINGLGSGRIPEREAGWLSTLTMGASMAFSWTAAIRYFSAVPEQYERVVPYNMVWLRFTDTLHADMGILLDPISVMMLVVITTVSFLVFFYSQGYMHGEKGYTRFFAFLSLFSFSMLGLVVATNIFQMYMFWELVGVSSYLLIGFYYQKPEAVAASKKAFIVTRFADFGFLLGILILSYYTGSFDFDVLTSADSYSAAATAPATFMGLSVITLALLLVFMGGAGKSAMFPLHIWLPDAMEGPTPVSALIHAATMVVAGVYLVARLFPVFSSLAPDGLEVVAWVGGFTSLFAAVIACTQTDIKRILAFSTMSQIGYMMLALGVSGYGGEEGLGFTSSMFHLFTHAFFKALLFLGAGSVIHAVNTNSILEMGSLRKYQPVTHLTFLVACLAIAGIPPFAGFFSKDEILSAAFANPALFYMALGVAGLTAFYMFRLYFLVFWGGDRHYAHAPHESPAVMTLPLIILAVFSALAGFVPFSRYVAADLRPYESHLHMPVATASVVVAVLGISVAGMFYFKPSGRAEKVSASLGALYRAASRKFYVDELYLFITHKLIFNLISRPIAWFDRHIVDGTMNAAAAVTNRVSEGIKGLQSGQLQKYAFVFLSGVLALILSVLYLMR
jgi:NADH-quinone oxidoreductase subunit L